MVEFRCSLIFGLAAIFAAIAATLVATLALGVETGLVIGVSVSLALYLFRTSRPHIATVGLVPGTEHFRNVLRYEVLTSPQLLSLRVDESLYFANARALEDCVNDAVARQPVPRMGTAREVALTVAYLASPAGAFVTGATLYVDGGVHLVE